MRGIPLKYSWRNLLARPGRSVLTLGGLALVVAVIVFLVAFGRSFGRALRMPGDPHSLIVLSKKAQTFELSSIPASELDLMASDVADQLETGPDGKPMFSREVYHFVNVRIEGYPDDEPKRALLHGIEPTDAERLLPGFALTSGRLPIPGMNELLVGRAVPVKMRVPEAAVGKDSLFQIRDTVYTVVGTFKAPGTIYENWVLTPTEDLRVTLGRRDYSFARMKVADGVDMAALAKRLSQDERYQVRVLPETEYFADFTEGFSFFERFAVALALVLGLSGLLTGMNTMHNAVVGRIREIGVLRVLGFSRGEVFSAFLIEAMLLTGAAGAIGCAAGYLTNGLPIRVPIAATFPIVVDPIALAAGFGGALLMGFLGLLFPLLRALKMPSVDAVRAV